MHNTIGVKCKDGVILIWISVGTSETSRLEVKREIQAAEAAYCSVRYEFAISKA